MPLQNTSLYICSNGKYVVHGLFTIIQNLLTIRSIIKIFKLPNHMLTMMEVRLFADFALGHYPKVLLLSLCLTKYLFRARLQFNLHYQLLFNGYI